LQPFWDIICSYIYTLQNTVFKKSCIYVDNPDYYEDSSRLALSTYLSINKIDIDEDLVLENRYGLLDDILELYSNLGYD